jgi:ATP-binding protein involved in chromosome partitioning
MRPFGESEATGAEGTSRVESDVAGVKMNLGTVKNIVAFASAKGGTGKSTVLTNVAVALAIRGRKVGLVDADLDSPSLAAILGMKRVRVFPSLGGIDPATGPLGLRVIGSNLLTESEPPPSFIDEESPTSSNGTGAVELTRDTVLLQIFGQTRFGALDFLLVDLAPGLREMELIARTVPLTGIVLLSHPSHLGVEAAKAALKTASRLGTPIIGIIENLAGFYCENCHSVRPLLPYGEMAALVGARGGTPIIGRLPFDPRLADACDRGAQFIKEYADAPLAKQLVEMTGRLEELLAARSRDPSEADQRIP